MNEQRIEELLRRLKTRAMPQEQLQSYTEQVRQRLGTEPSAVIPVHPALPWWVRWVAPVGVVTAVILAVALRPALERPLMLAQHPLVEEMEALSEVDPEGTLLSEGEDEELSDNDPMLDELEELEVMEELGEGQVS